MNDLPITLRPMVDSDKPCVFSDWLNSYRRHGYAARGVESKAFFREHHRLIERVMDRAVITIACPPDAPDVIFGWVCYEPGTASDTLHYVYVKSRYMRFGIATRLCAEIGESAYYTHSTDVVAHLRTIGKVPLNWSYNPYPFMLRES